MDPRLAFSLLSAVLLLLVAVVGAWLPLHLAQRSAAQHNHSTAPTAARWYHLGNCLAGGVMLSASFCHLLADALEDGLAYVGGFPTAPFLAALGFLLTLTADQVVVSINDASTAGSLDGPARQEFPQQDGAPLLNGDVQLSDAAGAKISAPAAQMPRPHDTTVDPELAVPEDPGPHPAPCCGQEALLLPAPATAPAAAAAMGQRKMPFATAVLLAAALCVHSTLEGMALGAQNNVTTQEDILIAIAAHKGLAAYALGASVVESGADVRRYWTVTLIFSAASPLAIFVGYALSEVSSDKGGAALSALAAGTFLYVAVMEIIPRELGPAAGQVGWQSRALKLFTLAVGFGAMSLLAIWA